MSNRTMSIVAYITIIGWVIAYLEYKKSADKSQLVNYHLGQALGLIILSFILGIGVSIVAIIIPSLYFLSLIVSVVTLVLLLLGIITANNEAIKPLPVVGKMFEGKFNFAA
jgi:uncharacterized membrane protein